MAKSTIPTDAVAANRSLRTSRGAVNARLRDLHLRNPHLSAAVVEASDKPSNARRHFLNRAVRDELLDARRGNPADYHVLLDIADLFGDGIGEVFEQFRQKQDRARVRPPAAQTMAHSEEGPAGYVGDGAEDAIDGAEDVDGAEDAVLDAASSDVGPADWPPPTPLDESADLPTFPVDCLPRWLADYAEAVAVATQVPVDLPAMVGLAILSLAGAKKYRVVVRPGWQEPLNIYSLTVLPPGNRKSAVFADMTAPVVEWEREELERQRPQIAAARARKELAEARAQKARASSLRSKHVSRR